MALILVDLWGRGVAYIYIYVYVYVMYISIYIMYHLVWDTCKKEPSGRTPIPTHLQLAGGLGSSSVEQLLPQRLDFEPYKLMKRLAKNTYCMHLGGKEEEASISAAAKAVATLRQNVVFLRNIALGISAAPKSIHRKKTRKSCRTPWPSRCDAGCMRICQCLRMQQKCLVKLIISCVLRANTNAKRVMMYSRPTICSLKDC